MTEAHTSDLAQRVLRGAPKNPEGGRRFRCDPQISRISIGDFTIELRGGDFWIVHESGEGATFPIEQFEQAVREFYDEHF